MEIIIIGFFWMVLSTMTFMGCASHCKELGKIELFMVVLIFAVAGPLFAVVGVLSEVLNCILPEGWDEG